MQNTNILLLAKYFAQSPHTVEQWPASWVNKSIIFMEDYGKLEQEANDPKKPKKEKVEGQSLWDL